MQRRAFSQRAAAVAALATLGPSAPSAFSQGNRSSAALLQLATPDVVDMGTNLSGMEWAKPGLRYGMSTAPNMHFTVPRAAEVRYLASQGYSKNRLPIQWELLQPMLHDTPANAAARAAIGEPGAFHSGYEAYITSVLDAHAAVGTRCIVDLHNYCRYQDFKYQADGSVLGLRVPAESLIRPYSSDASQVQVRIFSLASGATLTQAHFTDFWRRAASRWASHPGFGGYGLMNEPHDMPRAGGTVAWNQDSVRTTEDLTIWPTYAQAAITAIRAIDSANPIYVAGNGWDSAMALASKNPGFPLQGANLIYEVHMYLDAFSNGAHFDYDTETAKNYNAGFGVGAIHANTGVDRIKLAIDWTRMHGAKLALTEVGMPIDDVRWQAMFTSAVSYARAAGCEIYTWMGGSHWPIHNHAINHAPGWHQGKTLEPLVSGPLKAAAGRAQAVLFDDGPGYALAGTPLTITVYARGNLNTPLRLEVSSNAQGKLSKKQLTIPAGPNGQDSYTFTPGVNRVTTLSYTSDGQLGRQVPPPRKVYSLSNPVAYAATSLHDAAMAILAKYAASKWELADGYTDYLQGAPAQPGDTVRALSDSGYGSSAGNAMEMLNWVNKAAGGMGTMALPVMRETAGKKHSDHSAPNTWGFWCKKSLPRPGVQPHPKNRVPYDVEEPHFIIAAIRMPRSGSTGVLFQASQAEKAHASELLLSRGYPAARWLDSKGQKVELRGPQPLPSGEAAVLALVSEPGQQRLRVNSDVVADAAGRFAPSPCNQMLLGWGYASYHPRPGFGGHLYAAVTGKGVPGDDELAVLERYLASMAGQALA